MAAMHGSAPAMKTVRTSASNTSQTNGARTSADSGPMSGIEVGEAVEVAAYQRVDRRPGVVLVVEPQLGGEGRLQAQGECEKQERGAPRARVGVHAKELDGEESAPPGTALSRPGSRRQPPRA